MKKYYFNDGTAQQGPFTPEELQAKNITSETPVWYDGLPDWTTAGKLDELKDIIVHVPPPFHSTPVEQAKPVVETAATTTVTATPTPVVTTSKTTIAPVKSAKKSTAWLSYVLGLLVLGGAGYFVYQDMEKNKGNTNTTQTLQMTDSTSNMAMQQPLSEKPESTTSSTSSDTSNTETPLIEPTSTNTEPATTSTTTTTSIDPSTTPTTKTKVQTVTTKPDAATLKAKQLEAQKLAQKKAEEEKKKLQTAQAAQAAAALKEKEYRNNWPRYITFGNLDYKTNGDGISAFDVPIYNGTNGMIDKVTVRVDYMKRDKKVVKSETITIYNIPPGAGVNGKAPENKKGNSVKVFITSITSRKLHFCYPANNGTADDPYFCN